MIITPSYSFTRPNDTTAYASGDLVANSTTAGSVVPLSWSIQGCGGSGIIRAARLYKSNKTVTNGFFRVFLFAADPGVPTNGDNSALGVTSAADFLDVAAIDLSSGGLAGGTTGAQKRSAALAIGFKLPTISHKLYGLIDAQAAYTPAALEAFTVTLEIETGS